jgi:queuine/archaeosine tRNA-ribosyltransferase
MLYAQLLERYDVWWDEQIHSGDYRAEIEQRLAESRCVIPVWCRISRSEGNVIDEAVFAKRRSIPLMPVRIEDVEPPLGFGSLHTVDLLSWAGEPTHPGLQELFRNIEQLLGTRPRRMLRPDTLAVASRVISLPTFFRSVSSHETPLRPSSAIQALGLFGTEQMLVSAYDIIHEDDAETMISGVTTCRSAGAVVLLDSGNYEAYRKHDGTWQAERLREAMARTPHDLAFCFDDLHPPLEVDGIARGVIGAVERDSKSSSSPVLPIVHAPTDASGQIRTDLLPEATKRVTRELKPAMIAVAERELGDGLLARARTVHLIRRNLNELGFYQPLHLLGTGNPLSIAVLASVGADSFDGLEWCRTVVDHQSGRLYHFHQYEFFAWQSELATSPIAREAAASEKVAFSGKVVFHNLEFFSTWMNELRDHLFGGKADRFLSDKLPGGTKGMKLLEQSVPEVFG